MKKILESVLAKFIITSVIMSIISGVLVYKVTETKYEDKIAVLNKDINKMKEDMKKLVSENNKEEEVAIETIKEQPKENNTNKPHVKTEVKKTSNPNTEINKFNNILLEVSEDAVWYYELNPNNESMSLNSTIMLFKEYSDRINNVIDTVDYSVIGGNETRNSLRNISDMLVNFKNSDNYTESAANISSYVGEFLYYLEENYMQ